MNRYFCRMYDGRELYVYAKTWQNALKKVDGLLTERKPIKCGKVVSGTPEYWEPHTAKLIADHDLPSRKR